MRSNNAIPSEPHATASPSDALLRIDVHRDRRKPTILGPAMSVLIIAAPHVAGYQPRVMKSAIPNANSRTRAPCRQQYSCFPPTTFVNGCSCITAGDVGQGVAQRARAGQKRAAQRARQLVTACLRHSRIGFECARGRGERGTQLNCRLQFSTPELPISGESSLRSRLTAIT